MKVELKVVGGSRAGQTIPIGIPQFMIGRADDCHLKPRSELISRYHCAILTEEGYAAVRDLGSKNGVYLNGDRVSGEQELRNADRLVIGPLEFEVVLTVGLKGPMKSKVNSVSDVVARTMEQSSINAAGEKRAQAAQPQPQPAQAPAQVAQPAQPAPETPAKPTEPKTATQTSPAPNGASSSADDDEDLSWLLGEGDDDGSEAQTVSMALEDLDLPYTPKETEEEKPVESKPKSSGQPNSSDAAANLLKNFFKGGR